MFIIYLIPLQIHIKIRPVSTGEAIMGTIVMKMVARM